MHTHDTPKNAATQNENKSKGKAIAAVPVLQKKANNTGLPDNLKAGIENLSGFNMDDVKVHYNSDKPALLQAHAYAQGIDIHLASGQEKHLPHEAWHVVQQKQGRVKPTMQLKGKVNVNDDTSLEKEADVMGVKAVQKLDANGYKSPPESANLSHFRIIQRAPVPNLEGEGFHESNQPNLRLELEGERPNVYRIVSEGDHYQNLVYYEDGIYTINPVFDNEGYFNGGENELSLMDFAEEPPEGQDHYNCNDEDAVLVEINELLESINLRPDIDIADNAERNQQYKVNMLAGVNFPPIQVNVNRTILVQGNHRIRASQLAGYTQIPVIYI